MFVYTNISLFKTVQNLNNLLNLEEFWSFSINSLSQRKAFLTIFWHIFENKKRSGIKISAIFFKCVKQYDVIIKHKKYLGVISLITEK